MDHHRAGYCGNSIRPGECGSVRARAAGLSHHRRQGTLTSGDRVAHRSAARPGDRHCYSHEWCAVVVLCNAKGALAGKRLTAVDPRGDIGRAIPTARVIGCAIYMACAVEAPGLIHHFAGWQMSVGAPMVGQIPEWRSWQIGSATRASTASRAPISGATFRSSYGAISAPTRSAC